MKTIEYLEGLLEENSIILEDLANIQKAINTVLMRQSAIDQHSILTTTDLEGNILYVNERCCEISKYSREELIGKSHRIINSGYHSKFFFENLYSTLKKGEIWRGEIRNKAKDGSIFWVATTIVPIKDKEGNILEYFASRTDITHRKNMEEELFTSQQLLKEQNDKLRHAQKEMYLMHSRYLDIFYLAPIGYCTINEDGSLQEANLALMGKLDYSHLEITKLKIYDFILPEEHDMLNLFLKNVKETGNPKSFEVRMKKKNETIFWVQLELVSFTDNDGMSQYLIAMIDISQRKQIEHTLQTYTQELEKTNKTKDKFFNIIAHDLRNPFAGIMSLSDIMQTSLVENNNEQASIFLKYTHMIFNSSKSALSLIDNLAQWAKTQTGNIAVNHRKVSFNFLVSITIPIVSGNAFNKNISIETDLTEEDIVYADEYLITTVLRNLLTNAIKFTHTNGKIVVSTKNKDGFFEVSVNDSGIGMNPQNLEKIFKIDSKFSNLGTNNEKGTGLGLILCKEFVELQGGRIWVTSNVGIGSTFTFTLPLAQK
ncbi:MAG: PAS domain-containing sensor histidine kinase [Leptospiraceae bacterium]|nr:PAS domain-containing sensor histidine kinase [Leptospiraceae bacterium]MBP9161880.1 PAS domain-containing sensor histidine kinase [Leptospiraceae bacterium]